MPKSSVTPDQLLAHAGFVRSLARGLLSDEALVEDVVQETYIRALQSGPRRPEALTAWLRAVTRNLSFKALRGQGRRSHREEVAAKSESLPSTLDLVERETSLERVVQAVKSLPEHYRQVVMLRYFEDLPPRKIALEVDLPVNTVRMRLHRALKLLRGRLDDEYGGDRERWMGALALLAGLPLPDVGTATGLTGAGALVAAVVGTSLLVAGAWWWTRGSEHVDSGAAAPLVSAGADRADDAARTDVARTPGRAPIARAPETTTPTAPAPRTHVRGRVVDQHGGGVAGAAIHLDSGVDGPVVRGTSGADGRYEVLVPEDDRERITREEFPALVAARAAGHAPSALVVVPDEGEVVLRMRGPDATLRGRVTDAAGEPLAGVRVEVGTRLRLGRGHLGMQNRSAITYPGRLYPGLRVERGGALFQGFTPGRGYLGEQVLLGDGSQSRLLPAEVVLTDLDGRYELRGLEAGRTPLELRLEGYAPVHDAVDLRAGEALTFDPVLGAGTRLRGQITRADAQAPEGRTVAYLYPADTRDRQSRRVKRDRFSFEGLTEGVYVLYVEDVVDGLAVAATSDRIRLRGDGMRTWRGTLTSEGRVTGRVVGPTGDGLPGWQLDVALEDNLPIAIATVTSGPDGHFDLGILPPRPWHVRGYPPDGELAVPLVTVSGPSEDGQPLLLRVRDAEQPARLGGRLLLADGTPAPDGLDVLLYPGGGRRAVLTEVRGDEGRLESPPLPRGTYRIVLPDRGLCLVLDAAIEVGAGYVELGEVTLPDSGELRVSAPAGAPASTRVRIERVLTGPQPEHLPVFDGRADLPLRAEVGPGLYAVSFPELDPGGAPTLLQVRPSARQVDGRSR